MQGFTVFKREEIRYERSPTDAQIGFFSIYVRVKGIEIEAPKQYRWHKSKSFVTATVFFLVKSKQR